MLHEDEGAEQSRCEDENNDGDRCHGEARYTIVANAVYDAEERWARPGAKTAEEAARDGGYIRVRPRPQTEPERIRDAARFERCRARLLMPDEWVIVRMVERSNRRPLTPQEARLSLEQARALGELRP